MIADTAPTAAPRVVLVTGPSGAGRTTAVKALEDLGCETIDNLPLGLVPRLVDGPAGADGAPGAPPDGVAGRPLVLGVDVRNRDFSVAGFGELVDWLGGRGVAVEVLYLDCAAQVLERRYSETRRRHPLAPAESPAIGIEREFDLMTPIRARADLVIDTSELTPHELKAELARWFDPAGGHRLALMIHSFSYKRGMPRGIDMVFDCRFLDNPYWRPELRALDGRDAAVVAHIAKDGRFAPFMDKVNDIAEFLLPAYRAEGKSYLSIGFGCTGGQHRSVAMAERIAASLRDAGWQAAVRHHELERRGRASAAPDVSVSR